MAKTIIWAGREKRRQVNAAVGRDFLKTITEPLTNSDSILKNKLGVNHAAGLVDQLMKLKPNDQVNTAELKSRIKQTERRTITLEFSTAGDDG